MGVRANVGGLAVPLAVVGCWQLLVWTRALDLQFLPAPHQIAGALIAEVTAGEMASDLRHTLAVALLAVALAAALGGGLGIAG
jgi:sulfonate transport system permease protein